MNSQTKIQLVNTEELACTPPLQVQDKILEHDQRRSEIFTKEILVPLTLTKQSLASQEYILITNNEHKFVSSPTLQNSVLYDDLYLSGDNEEKASSPLTHAENT